eukprot:894577-Pleurochrysis_carterae.AAC.1
MLAQISSSVNNEKPPPASSAIMKNHDKPDFECANSSSARSTNGGQPHSIKSLSRKRARRPRNQLCKHDATQNFIRAADLLDASVQARIDARVTPRTRRCTLCKIRFHIAQEQRDVRSAHARACTWYVVKTHAPNAKQRPPTQQDDMALHTNLNGDGHLLAARKLVPDKHATTACLSPHTCRRRQSGRMTPPPCQQEVF